jgi:hypothetical protein
MKDIHSRFLWRTAKTKDGQSHGINLGKRCDRKIGVYYQLNVLEMRRSNTGIKPSESFPSHSINHAIFPPHIRPHRPKSDNL